MRLFVAVALDPVTRERVVAEQRRLRSALGAAAQSLRLVDPNQLHLTLAFIGEVDDERGRAIAGRFAIDIEQPPFELALGDAGVFPSRGAPRVLWLGCAQGVDEVTALQERVVRRLGAAGVDVDRRPFSPHLTLGRWRAGTPRAGVAPLRRVASDKRRSDNHERRTKNAERRVARLMVNEVTMFQSRLSASGATYTAIAHARLSCPSSS